MKSTLLSFIAAVILLTGCGTTTQREVSTNITQQNKQQFCDVQDTVLASLPGSCTTFAIQMGDRVLFGNNEDYENPMTYYWVIPSTEEGYGGIYLGYEYGRPQGGINEKGLAYDGLALPPESLNYHPEWPDIGSSFTAYMAKVMRQCADVEQAVEMMTRYNWTKGTVAAQILIADASGEAAIIGAGADGELAVTRKSVGDRYLLGTNFNVVQLDDDDFEIPCWRYSKAKQLLEKIEKKGVLSVDGVFNILDKVHQEGRKNNTLYSNVFDLKNGVVYLTYWYQFDEVITLNVSEEVNSRTNTGEIPNSSDKVRLKTLFSEKTVTKAEKAFQRYVNEMANLEKVAWVWVGQSVICAILALIDLLRRSSTPWYVKLIWLLVSFFLGVVGLLVYWVTFKCPSTKSLCMSKFKRALGSATLSSIGCTFAFFLISLSVFFLAQNANLGIFALLIPFVISLMSFRAPMMVFFTNQNYVKSVVKYILPELFSSIVAVTSIVFVNQYLGDYFNQYSRYIGTPTDIFFWVQFSLYAAAGMIILYLLHLLLIHLKVNLWQGEFSIPEESDTFTA